ncbi:uncharacterized protein LOC127846507 [Dreissena polymorpha]|uniref:Uncharacterized protein n=1 Tax=Dreissena polymorpha TaxID=45954 RepID=A0A9D4DXY3_DREPO|nr:uncharacterized protein LOC127846507 [Dreissena polymorpha]KAH3770109.1 hypothetical protein DPMN_171389 [Dreissena polymorpha]
MTHRNKKGKFQAIRKEIRKNSAAEKHEQTIDQKTPQKEDIKDPGGEQNQSKKRNIEKDKIQNGNGHKKKGTEVAKTIDSAENIPRKTKKIDKISQASKKSDTDGQQAKNHNIFTTTSPRGKLIADVLLQRLPNGAIELPAKLCSVIGDVDKMKPFFVRDPKTGKSLVDPNARRIQDGSTVLQLAIKSRNSAAVKLLLDNGADCSLADYMGDNAVMLAIKEGEAAVINQLWPQRGALDVNHANIFGITALHLAADRKWEGCVNFLLQNGANPNATSTSGITPLMFAACKGALKIVDLLLKAGADVLRVDNEFDTCVSRVPLEANREVVEHVLGHIGDVQKEQFLGLTMDLMQRKPPPTDINNVLVNKFLPLIEACTRLPSYREAFHRKNVVRFLNVNMRHEIQSLEAATIASHIVFCVMFRFNKDAVDQGFVYQFLECKGPDTVFSLVTRLKVALKISHKETLMFFLPVIGLSEIPAGRIWLERNNLLVSEYLGYFERDSLKVYLAPLTCRHWCMEADRFPLVDRTWKRFYDIVNKFAAKQRQKNMLELLRDEELEKTRQAKRKEKEKKTPRTEPNSQRNPINIDYETIFGYPLETDVEEKRSSQLDADYKIISDMFCGVSPPACSNDNAARNDAAQHNTNSNGVPSALKTSAPVVVSNVAKQDEWTTVQGKKMTKDKVDEKQTQRVESPTKQLRFPKKDTTPSKNLTNTKPKMLVPLALSLRNNANRFQLLSLAFTGGQT